MTDSGAKKIEDYKRLTEVCGACGKERGEHSREALTSANPHGWKWQVNACPVGPAPFHREHVFIAAHAPGAKKIAQVEPWMTIAAKVIDTSPNADVRAVRVKRYAQVIAEVYAEHAPGVTPQLYSEQVVINLARELYDRFVMGGWQPEDAYHQIRAMLGWPAAPKEGTKCETFQKITMT